MQTLKVLLVFPGLALSLFLIGCAPGGSTNPNPGPIVPGNSNDTVEKKDPVRLPDNLRVRIKNALDHVRNCELLTTHSFWTVFHGILGNGLDTMLLNPVTGERTPAIEFIAKGGKLRGLEFIPTADGVDIKMGIMFDGQGHQDQFVSEMAQVGLQLNAEFLINGQKYKFEDFINESKARARINQKQELSWTVMILSHFYGTKMDFTNRYNEHLKLEDLVRYELDQPIHSAACGGTHRLFGLAWVYHLHKKEGGKDEGLWEEVRQHQIKYQDMAKANQNADGSFSAKYLDQGGWIQNLDRRINTTGHVLEWLALSLPDDRLHEEWVEDAAGALSAMILTAQNAPLDGGSLYHASHGLNLYYQRAYPEHSGGPPEHIPLPSKTK